MLENVKDFFMTNADLTVDSDGQPTDRDLVVSTLVLLSSIAHADSEFEEQELAAIVTSLFSEFEIAQDEAADLLEIADFLRKDGSKIDQFIATINSKFDADQKLMILAMIWRIIISDGQAERFETSLATQIRQKLGLSMEEAMRARELAQTTHIAIDAANKLHESAESEEEE